MREGHPKNIYNLVITGRKGIMKVKVAVVILPIATVAYAALSWTLFIKSVTQGIYLCTAAYLIIFAGTAISLIRVPPKNLPDKKTLINEYLMEKNLNNSEALKLLIQIFRAPQQQKPAVEITWVVTILLTALLTKLISDGHTGGAVYVAAFSMMVIAMIALLKLVWQFITDHPSLYYPTIADILEEILLDSLETKKTKKITS